MNDDVFHEIVHGTYQATEVNSDLHIECNTHDLYVAATEASKFVFRDWAAEVSRPMTFLITRPDKKVFKVRVVVEFTPEFWPVTAVEEVPVDPK